MDATHREADQPLEAATNDHTPAATPDVDRKPYTTPVLTDFGAVTEITKGTFAGVGADSGIYS